MEQTVTNSCNLCPRNCSADRSKSKGYCGEGQSVRVARAALHMWEEPCISGERGSGTVFFTGCPLKCVFCQNGVLARSEVGEEVSVARLADIFMDLQNQKANNINLVTAGHFIPQVAEAIQISKKNGLRIPVVYNCGGYEKAESLKLLDGLVDVYLPDMKYYDNGIAKKYSNAPDYFEVAKQAIEEMFRQVGVPVFNEKNNAIEAEMLMKGVIVRHLVLPGQVEDSKRIVKYLYDTYGNNLFVSIMNQYTPMEGIEKIFPELGRTVSAAEYDEVVDYAIEIGLENGFIQEGETAKESFIPEFNGKGVKE